MISANVCVKFLVILWELIRNVMKRIKFVLPVAFIFGIAFSINAQTNGRLMGPKAKNLKPWEKKGDKELLFAQEKPRHMKSLQAKNDRPWSQRTSVDFVAVSSDSNKLKGYKEKNRKPWTKSS